MAIKISIPYQILTDRSMRPVRHLILAAAILAISLSQNISYYGTSATIPTHGLYLLSLISAVAYLTVAYIHIYILVPRYLIRKDYSSYFLLSALFLVGIGMVRFAQNNAAAFLWDINTRPWGIAAVFDSISDFALNTLCFTGVSLTVLLKYWLQEENRISELESGRLAVEVESVKNAIDPEMLLGTLNRCGIEAGTSPESSAEMILKLSEILRYQLYESGKDKVFLNSDIAFIRKYLELERLRNSSFDYSLNAESISMVYISPLIFMPVIKLAMENRKPQQKLNIGFKGCDDKISFHCDCMEGIVNENITTSLKSVIHIYGDRVEYSINEHGEIYIDIRHE